MRRATQRAGRRQAGSSPHSTHMQVQEIRTALPLSPPVSRSTCAPALAPATATAQAAIAQGVAGGACRAACCIGRAQGCPAHGCSAPGRPAGAAPARRRPLPPLNRPGTTSTVRTSPDFGSFTTPLLLMRSPMALAELFYCSVSEVEESVQEKLAWEERLRQEGQLTALLQQQREVLCAQLMQRFNTALDKTARFTGKMLPQPALRMGGGGAAWKSRALASVMRAMGAPAFCAEALRAVPHVPCRTGRTCRRRRGPV